jgi:hypothetical protein
MRRAHVSLVALSLAAGLCTIGQAHAQNSQASGLPARGTPAASDIIPCQPSGGSLEGCTAGALAGLSPTAVSLNRFSGIDPTGATDSTAAIQAAINTGQSLTCDGVYKVSATLAAAGTANWGQMLIGAAASGGGAAANRCVFKPASGFTGFVLSEGTSSSYQPGMVIENVTFDLTNVADAATNGAINQQGVYAAQYINVSVVNDGSSKRAWLFNNGAELSSMYDCQGNILDFEGVSGGSPSNPTTINVNAHNGNQVIMSWTNGIRIRGGAFQNGSGSPTHFSISNSGDIDINTDVEGSGTYVAFANFTYGVRLHSELGGFSGTYYTGTPGTDSELEDDLPGYQSYSNTMRTWGYDRLNNHGASAVSSYLSGATGADYLVEIGRASAEHVWGVASATNDVMQGTSAGDMVLEGLTSGASLWIAADQNANSINIQLSATGINVRGGTGAAVFLGGLTTGYFSATGGQVKPASDGQMLTFENAAGTGLEVITTSATPASSVHSFVNGTQVNGYTNNGSTLAWTAKAASGTVAAGAELYPGGGTTSAPVIQSAAGLLAGTGNPASGLGMNGDFYFRGDCTHGTSDCVWHKESGAWVDLN